METENNRTIGANRSFSNHTYVNSEIKILKISLNWIYIEEFILTNDLSSEKHVENVTKVNGCSSNTIEFIQMKSLIDARSVIDK